ncbi:MAG: hypothetical protein KA059_00070 [Elusimicrobiales bacterium]|nr:hypothetical protein [Elusimicrobiales bacterium]
MTLLMAVHKGVILLTVSLGASLIGHVIVVSLLNLIPTTSKQYDSGSKWIGFCERALIAIFVCLGLIKETIFIFAVKTAVISFRVPKNVGYKHQKELVEYMLVGTMISYFVALFLGLIGKYFYVNLGKLL